MNEPPKNQHFLPRFYLRGFGEDDAVRVRRRDGRHFTTGTAAVGHERFMYDHPEIPDGAVETHYLKDLDTRASEAFTSVRDGGIPGRLAPERWRFAHFLAVQMTRTPERRAQLTWHLRLREFADDRSLTLGLVGEFLEVEHLGFRPSDGEVKAAYEFATYMDEQGYDENEARGVFLQMLLNPSEELLEALVIMDWSLETARKPRFITSDSPLVMWREPTPRDDLEGIGIANADEVRFPFDSSCQLVLRRPERGDNRYEVEPQRVRMCNQDMAFGCHEFIVGHPRRAYQLEQLNLPEHRPVLRFNKGPLVQRDPEGVLSETGDDVLHVWMPRR